MASTMEAWLAQLEMDQIHSLIENRSYEQYQESGTMEACFDEQLAATLGEDFPYSVYATSDDTSSPSRHSLIDQFIPTPHISDGNNTDTNIKNDVEESQPPSKKQAQLSGGRKRIREPSKVQDHILAERRRRELLSQLFISLSAIVPGLKKIDKISVLVEAIKHMKQLQEKVKVLEQVAAKRTMESSVVMIVKKSKVMVDNNNDNVSSSTMAGDSSSGSSGGSGNGGGDDNISSFPEIEVMISGKALLLRVYCEKQKGIVAKLFAEVGKHDLSVTTSSVIPFENLALHITVLAQMGRGFNNKNVKDFVRTLRNALRLTSYQRNESSEDEH